MLDYVDKHRAELTEEYPEFDKFDNNFEVTASMVDTIVVRGENAGIEKDEESLSFTIDNMKREVKALIARDIFSRNDFFKVLYKDDEAINKALDVIKNQQEYNHMLVSAD